MRTKLISFLEDKRKKTDGHCGTSLPQLLTELDCELQELKELLNDLYAKNLIEIKDGIHGKMIFYKTVKPKK
jgi:hypothetical protein